MAPQAGLEPATERLTAVCSTNWATGEQVFLITIKMNNFVLFFLRNGLKRPFYKAFYDLPRGEMQKKPYIWALLFHNLFDACSYSVLDYKEG